MKILAVDPGLSGAVATLDSEGGLSVARDFKVLPDIAAGINRLAAGVTHALMELVHAMPGQGVCSMFSFGRAAGVADGALALSLPQIEVEQISPQKWQNHFRRLLGIPKEVEFDSRAVATKLVPQSEQFLLRKKDHNTADAILLALWKLQTDGSVNLPK